MSKIKVSYHLLYVIVFVSVLVSLIMTIGSLISQNFPLFKMVMLRFYIGNRSKYSITKSLTQKKTAIINLKQTNSLRKMVTCIHLVVFVEMQKIFIKK